MHRWDALTRTGPPPQPRFATSHADIELVTTASALSPFAASARRLLHRSRIVLDRWRLYAADRLRPEPAPAWDDMHIISAEPAAEATIAMGDEARDWMHAHRSEPDPSANTGDKGENTALIFANADVQQWMGATLADLGWIVTEPVMLSEGWVPARGETTETGQPATTFTTPSKTFARKNDPASSKKAGAIAAANQSVTVSSQQGQLLFAYHEQHLAKPGTGYTAAEAVNAAGLRTDGATGSPWHRVTDLRDMGLLTYLLDGTTARVTRKNDSNSDGQVLVITPLGLRAAAALTALREHGYDNAPLIFDGHTEPTLFEDLSTTLARINATASEAPAHDSTTDAVQNPAQD